MEQAAVGDKVPNITFSGHQPLLGDWTVPQRSHFERAGRQSNAVGLPYSICSAGTTYSTKIVMLAVSIGVDF